MKGFRFYEEFKTPQDKRKGISEGNVFAACVENGIFWSGDQACYEGMGAVYFQSNSPVCWTAASIQVLNERCKRIPESRAREIHPELFKSLDETEG